MFNKQTQQHNDIMLNFTQHKPIHETITNVSCTCITYSQVVQHTAFTFVDLCLSYKIHAIEYLRRLTSLTTIPILSRNVSSEVYSIFSPWHCQPWYFDTTWSYDGTNNWGEPERAPHLSVLREKPRAYVCLYVCICM